MRTVKRKTNIISTILFNLLLNLEGLLPSLIFVALHFIFDISLIWAGVFAAFWFIGIVVKTLLLSYAVRCGNEKTPYRENKNPYSSGKYKKTK